MIEAFELDNVYNLCNDISRDESHRKILHTKCLAALYSETSRYLHCQESLRLFLIRDSLLKSWQLFPFWAKNVATRETKYTRLQACGMYL
jgi:hypothetical protein